MKTPRFFPALTVAVLASSGAAHADSDCLVLATRAQTVAERTAADPIELLNLIDREVSANPACACEIVKAAIIGTGCDDAIVGYIVETAVRAAPEQMRLISQCAIATAPDSLIRVQQVMARLDPAAGEKSTSAKGAKGKGLEVSPAQTVPDPLDVPIVIVPPIPPVVNPPPSTVTDF